MVEIVMKHVDNTAVGCRLRKWLDLTRYKPCEVSD